MAVEPVAGLVTGGAAAGGARGVRIGDPRSLAESGCDDIPRNGLCVLGAIADAGAPLGEIIDQLGVSKQAAGQLVDTLMVRCYLDRSIDPADRRRVSVTLRERGEAAAAVIRSVLAWIDDALVARVGADYVAHAQETLASLVAGEPADA